MNDPLFIRVLVRRRVSLQPVPPRLPKRGNFIYSILTYRPKAYCIKVVRKKKKVPGETAKNKQRGRSEARLAGMKKAPRPQITREKKLIINEGKHTRPTRDRAVRSAVQQQYSSWQSDVPISEGPNRRNPSRNPGGICVGSQYRRR